MAKSKKQKKAPKPAPTAEELKAQLWQDVMAGKIEVDSYAQPEMYAMLEKIKKSLSLEVPACRMTLEELHDHRDSMYSDKNSLAKALNYAIEISNDKQKALEYHETEMLRHSRMYDAVKAEILNGQEFGNQ